MQQTRRNTRHIDDYIRWGLLYYSSYPVHSRSFYLRTHPQPLGKQARSARQQSHPRRVNARLIGAYNSSWKRCRRYDKGYWSYLVGGPNSPRHGATNGLLWYILEKTPARQKLATPSTLRVLVCGRLFSGHRLTLSTVYQLNGGHSIIRNSKAHSAARSTDFSSFRWHIQINSKKNRWVNKNCSIDIIYLWIWMIIRKKDVQYFWNESGGSVTSIKMLLDGTSSMGCLGNVASMRKYSEIRQYRRIPSYISLGRSQQNIRDSGVEFRTILAET